MGYPTKVQLIQRDNGQQWLINLPAVIARSMNFAKGEVVEWSIADNSRLVLTRTGGEPPAEPARIPKKPRKPSSRKSSKAS